MALQMEKGERQTVLHCEMISSTGLATHHCEPEHVPQRTD